MLLSQTYTDTDHDQYQHVVTYSDETTIEHSYLNIDDDMLRSTSNFTSNVAANYNLQIN